MSNSSWLEYSKTILKKVSFDKKIFKKELRKLLKRLSKPEIHSLKAWCTKTFNEVLVRISGKIIQDYLLSQSFR